MATLADQLAFEIKHRDLGRERMASIINAAEEQGRLTDTPLGTGVLRRYLQRLSETISLDITEELGVPGRSKQYAVLLKNMDPDVLALVTLDTVIEHLELSDEEEDSVPLGSMATAIGRAIHSEILLTEFKDISPDLFEVLTNSLKSRMSKNLRHKMTVYKLQAADQGLELPEWTTAQRAQVGSYLIGLLINMGVLEQFTRWIKRKSVYCVSLGTEVVDLMEAIRERVIERSGFAAPCLIPPQPWTGEEGVGGFHGALKMRAPRFFKGTSEQLEIMQTEGCDLTITLAALNYQQRVAWKVNPFIHKLALLMLQYKYELKKSITSVAYYPKPDRPEWLDSCDDMSRISPRQKEEFDKWKLATRDWHTENKKRARIEVRMRLALAAARDFGDLERFYFVCQADDRGREYFCSGPLNPQGSDLQKALLHSAVGGPVDTPEAVYWFKLNIATKYGIDKLAPADCIKWVDNNHDNIIAAAADPLNREAFDWWSQADKPLQFIAVCDEYRRWVESPLDFEARIAVSMDGTCNGLQNYSALLRDPVGGRATNLISAESGIPNDIYGDVAIAAFKRLEADVGGIYRPGWLLHGFNRKLTKPSVMTQVYGSTFGTCRKSIVAYCVERALFEDEQYEHADYAARLVWEGIGDVVVAARECMEWLRKCAGLIMAEGAEFISWPAPSGFRVVQVYRKPKLVRVKAYIGKSVSYAIQVAADDADDQDKLRHRNAFPPNFIHSVDASHLAMVAVGMGSLHEQMRLEGRLSKIWANESVFLHFIHDDFGALPHMAADLARIIREKFVEMHENYDIESIRKDYWFLPEPPKKGSLDIRCVLDSINFFR